MTDETPRINAMHKLYSDLSGLPVQLTMSRIWAWQAWLTHGWNEADLRLVIAHLHKRTPSAPVWAKMNLMFTRFIADPVNFEELLQEARAIARVPKFDPGKAQVLRDTRRSDKPDPSKPKTPEQIMREAEAFKEFQKFRDSL